MKYYVMLCAEKRAEASAIGRLSAEARNLFLMVSSSKIGVIYRRGDNTAFCLRSFAVRDMIVIMSRSSLSQSGRVNFAKVRFRYIDCRKKLDVV